MIKKSLLGFIVIFLAYTGVMYLRPELSVTQNQEQTNLINAQKYLYSQQPHPAVIVGSSLSSRLVMAELPGFENLALSGLTAIDGLNIIKHGTQLPEHIFIETNVLYKGTNQNFNDQIFDPIPFYTKKYLITLRDGKEPLGFTEIVISSAISKIFPAFFAPYTPTTLQAQQPKFHWIKTAYAQESANEVTAMASPQPMGIIATEYAEAPDPVGLNNNLTLLKEYIDYFTSQGVEVYFYELPIHADLIHSPKAEEQRTALLAKFPVDSYVYILPPENIYGNDGDGIHMNNTVAKEYTIYFKKQTDAFMALE